MCVCGRGGGGRVKVSILLHRDCAICLASLLSISVRDLVILALWFTPLFLFVTDSTIAETTSV